MFSSVCNMEISRGNFSQRRIRFTRTSDRRRNINIIRLPSVFIVEAKGVGGGTAMTMNSIARQRTPVALEARIRGLLLVKARLDLLEIERELFTNPIDPHRHEAIKRGVIRLQKFAHGMEKRLALSLSFWSMSLTISQRRSS